MPYKSLYHKSFKGKSLPLYLCHFFPVGYNLSEDGRVGVQMRTSKFSLQESVSPLSGVVSGLGSSRLI